MVALADFSVAEFSQGQILGGDFQFKKAAQPGVCLALTASWFLMSTCGKDYDTYDDLLKIILKDFNKSIVKQSIYDDALRGAGSVTGTQIAMLWNTVSTTTSIRFKYRDSGTLVDPFKKAMIALPKDFFLMRLFFTDGSGHAIGVARSTDGYNVFDPNFGIMALAVEETDDFSAALWSEYRAMGLNVQVWQFFEMHRAQTAKQRMEAALAKLK